MINSSQIRDFFPSIGRVDAKNNKIIYLDGPGGTQVPIQVIEAISQYYIRSNANTVINENAPSDARTLLAYYKLEQYPKTYLFYGPMFSDIYAPQDESQPYIDGKP